MTVADIGGTDEAGYWLCVSDESFEFTFEIGSHADYWDFVSHLAGISKSSSGSSRDRRAGRVAPCSY